jgi:trans-aconitate methyltransferase
MTVKALPEALKLWEHPAEMMASWDSNEYKYTSEQTIAKMIGEVDSVADCGCGPGMFTYVLYCKEYYGFDQSPQMVEMANRAYAPHFNAHFAIADIFKYCSSRHYNIALLIDVLQHQEDPLGALDRWLSLWDADRYIFTILVGNEHEVLLNSVVVEEKVFDHILECSGLTILSDVIIPVGNEKFHARLMEVSKEKMNDQG